jgi:hypothetical protein
MKQPMFLHNLYVGYICTRQIERDKFILTLEKKFKRLSLPLIKQMVTIE